MAEETADGANRDRRVGEGIAAYLEALDAGRAPDREAILRGHPQLARDLADHSARHDRFERLVEPVRPLVPASQPETQGLTAADPEATAECQGPSAGPVGPARPGAGETAPAPSAPAGDLTAPADGDRGDG